MVDDREVTATGRGIVRALGHPNGKLNFPSGFSRDRTLEYAPVASPRT